MGSVSPLAPAVDAGAYRPPCDPVNVDPAAALALYLDAARVIDAAWSAAVSYLPTIAAAVVAFLLPE